MKFWRGWLFAGVAVILGIAAVAPPLDRLSDRSFAWHMLQHLILLYAVSLFIVLARPFELFSSLCGKTATANVVRAIRPWHTVASPPVTLGVFVGTLWMTHFSSLYEGSLENAWTHGIEHSIYLAAGIAFWLPVVAPAPLRPLSYPARLFYLAIALPQGALLAMALYAARAPLYPHYAIVTGSASAALSDQHNAAAVMWVGGGLLLFCTFLATLGIWAYRERETVTA